MSLINLSDIYACIHQTLRNDPQIQTMLGLTPDSTMEEMALKIQKRRNPQSLVLDNLPMISFYKNPGVRGQNYLEYRFIVDFDIYTQDDVELALNIADRIAELFDDQFLPLSKGSVFRGRYVTSAEDNTDLENTFKYFVQIGFSIGINENS